MNDLHAARTPLIPCIRSALRHVLRTFFDGSTEQAISALLDESSTKLSPAELDRLARMIEDARRSGV